VFLQVPSDQGDMAEACGSRTAKLNSKSCDSTALHTHSSFNRNKWNTNTFEEMSHERANCHESVFANASKNEGQARNRPEYSNKNAGSMWRLGSNSSPSDDRETPGEYL